MMQFDWMMKVIQRTINSKIKEALKAYPIIVITGARQIGKSTEVYKFVEKGYKYVSLDNIDERKLAQSDPKYFIERHGYPLIVDEIQYAPVVMEVIEEIVNKNRLEQKNDKGLFILTGSQTFKLMKNVTQSMAGACGYFIYGTIKYERNTRGNRNSVST